MRSASGRSPARTRPAGSQRADGGLPRGGRRGDGRRRRPQNAGPGADVRRGSRSRRGGPRLQRDQVVWKDKSDGKEGAIEVPLGGGTPLPDPSLVVRADVFLPALGWLAGSCPTETSRRIPPRGSRSSKGQGDLRGMDLLAFSRHPSVRACAFRAPSRRGNSEGQEVTKRRAARSGSSSPAPNVGKSSIFNKLVRRRKSIVHDLPGMTRDVLEAEARLPDGRAYLLLDTGGYDPGGKEELPAAVRDKAVAAIQGADLVFLVMDASAGVLAGDRAAPRHPRGRPRVRGRGQQVDRRTGRRARAKRGSRVSRGLRRLGRARRRHRRPAERDRRAADGLSARRIPRRVRWPGPRDRPRDHRTPTSGNRRSSTRCSARVAPSCRRSRARRGIPWTRRSKPRGGGSLVDTAGIRRRGKTEQGPEVLSVLQAKKRIEDATWPCWSWTPARARRGRTRRGVLRRGRGEGPDPRGQQVGRRGGPRDRDRRGLPGGAPSQIPFARHAPVILRRPNGPRVSRILKTAAQVAENRRRRSRRAEPRPRAGSAGQGAPPASGRPFKVFYVAQTGVAPPTFALVASRADPPHFSEERRSTTSSARARTSPARRSAFSSASARAAAKGAQPLKVLPTQAPFRVD